MRKLGGGLTRIAYHDKKVKRLKWVIAHFQKVPVICLSKNAAVSVKMCQKFDRREIKKPCKSIDYKAFKCPQQGQYYIYYLFDNHLLMIFFMVVRNSYGTKIVKIVAFSVNL